MRRMNMTTVPDEYKQAAPEASQGKLHELTYTVNTYINAARQLVTNLPIDANEAGRPVVAGEPIQKSCNVYVPAGYHADDKTRRYDVLYLLHGVGGDQFEWLRGSGEVDGKFVICNILDYLIASGEIDPLIVVFPNGRSSVEWKDTSFTFTGINLLGFYYFDYELRHDLISIIESTYPTFANYKDTTPEGMAYNRKHRAIAGLSMGGMQALNLTLGGYRSDAAEYVADKRDGLTELAPTVPAAGMQDLFAYVGAFSNAPTTSDGSQLGSSIKAAGHRFDLLYMTCGDADEISISHYHNAIEGLQEAAGDRLGRFYQIVMSDGVHDFNVWTTGAYHFAQLAFQPVEEQQYPESIRSTLTLT